MNRSLIFLTSLLILMSSFQAFSFQKVDELLADPDITWVGEVYVDYIPNANILEPVEEETLNLYGSDDYNSFELLKIQNNVTDDWLKPLPTQLSHRLLQLSKNAAVYKDASLNEKLSYGAYQKAVRHELLDTIITFDPETFEEVVQIVPFNLELSMVKIFRVKQLLTYNESTNKLNIIPLAIAPIASMMKNKKLRKEVLFWMPIKEAFKSINLKTSSIDWAKRLTKDIPSKAVQTIKGSGNMTSIFDKMVAYYKTHSSTSKVYYGGGQELNPWNASEIENMGSPSVDTIITFHPETFEEIVQVIKYGIEPNFTVKVRLIQDWVWNSKKQEMQIRVLGFGPVPEKDAYSTTYSPTYYIKYGE